MADEILELARERSRTIADRVLVERTRTALQIVLLVLPTFVLADLVVNPQYFQPLFLQKLFHLAIVLTSLFLLHRHPRREWAAPLALLNMAVAIGLTVATSTIVREDMTTPLLGVILVAVSAGVMPWSLVEHFAVIAISAVAMLANLVLVPGEMPRTHAYRFVAIVTVWILSVYLSRDLGERRLKEAREAIERERAQDALRRRLDFEQLITAISARFIKLPAEEVDKGIAAALRAIGEFAGIDRSYVFLLSPDKTSLRLTHWWIPGEGRAPVDDFRALPIDHYRWLVPRLRAGEIVQVGSLSELPPEAETERRTLVARGIRSVAMVPMVAADALIGFLGFGSTTEERRWENESHTLLRMVAEILSNAIERRRIQVALQESRRRLEAEAEISAALARVGQELISTLNTTEMLNRLCQTTTEVLLCDFAHTWLWKLSEKALIAVAGYGDKPEVWEAIRVMKIPREALAEGTLTNAVENVGFGQVQIAESDADALPKHLLPITYGLSSLICVALRRGDEMIGALAAGFRGNQTAFTQDQERIMRGIAQLASIALENTQLLEQLNRANRLKAEFVSNMSHELRTPLNIILGYAELSLGGDYGDLTPELQDSLSRIVKSAHDLEELVNATLDVGRLETGKLPVDVKDVALGELLEEVDREARELKGADRLAWAWHFDEGTPPVRTDPVKLKVVLKNLLSNAVKFTDRGGVTVEVQPRGTGVEFAVHDTGIGIAPEIRAVIFEPFRQGDGSITRTYGGIGLGLYIARSLVSLLGGSMDFDSEVGRGSVFRVWLPREARTRGRTVRLDAPQASG